MALAGCASGAALVHAQGDPIAEAQKQFARENRDRIEADGRACRDRGGEVGYRGMGLAPLCTIRHRDGGKACRSNADCQGECIVDTERLRIPFRALPSGTPTAGQCTAMSPHLGCYIPVAEGRAGYAICAD
jgi:hypothetical protein